MTINPLVDRFVMDGTIAEIGDRQQWPAIQKQLRTSQRYAVALDQILSIVGRDSPAGQIAERALQGKDA